MSMTLEEMQLAVCEKLHGKGVIANHGLYPKWNSGRIINWPTEGLQVCHEAEKLITKYQAQNYMDSLSNIVRQTSWPQSKEEAQMLYLSATYEQRLEALCRVWFPEKFQQ